MNRLPAAVIILLLPAAASAAEANWKVTSYLARPGYLLEAGSHRAALDLIGDTPWLNPATQEMESPILSTITVEAPVIDYTDPDAPGLGAFDADQPFPENISQVDDDHFALSISGLVRIPREGLWSFIVGRADTFQLSVGGRGEDEDGRPLTGGCCNAFAPVFTFFLPAGDVPVLLTYGEATGAALLELSAAEGAGVPFTAGGPYRLVGDVEAGGLEVVSTVPCEDPPEVAVIEGAPAGPVAAGSRVTLEGGGSSAGGAGSLDFRWTVVSGPGSIEGAADGATVVVTSAGGGEVTVRLTVDDGVCRNGASLEVAIVFEGVNQDRWTVTLYRAVPRYRLDHEDHRPVLDLIAGVPWRDPFSGDMVNPIASTVVELHPFLDFHDPDAPGTDGVFEPTRPFPGEIGGQDEDDFAIHAQGILRVPQSGFYSFIAGHDDTFQLTVNGESFDVNGVPSTSGCCGQVLPVFTFQLPQGEVPIELSYGASSEGAFLELFAAPGFDVPFGDDSLYRLVGDVARGGLEVLESCPDAPEAATIEAPPGLHPVGTEVVLDGSGSTAGGAGVLAFDWDVVSGPGVIVGADDAPTVRVRLESPGDVVVELTVDDGLCANPGTSRVTLTARATDGSWIRGDGNGDRLVDISDAVSTLSFLFTGGAPPACRPALDSNGDSLVDISDPVSDLGVLFLGAPLPASWQTCEPFDCPSNCP